MLGATARACRPLGKWRADAPALLLMPPSSNALRIWLRGSSSCCRSPPIAMVHAVGTELCVCPTGRFPLTILHDHVIADVNSGPMTGPA